MRCLQNHVVASLGTLFNAELRPAICSTIVRHFAPKSHPHVDGTYRGQAPIRFGYEAHHHEKGLLPRLRIKEARLPTMPITSKEDNWSRRKATMGKNDFIKIMGDDENVQQHELLTHVPDWLKGYRAGKEYSVLMLKRKEFDHWKFTKPVKWGHMEKRIRYLYKRINNKYRPPPVELLNKSRYD